MESKTSNQLEMLALEKTLMSNVVGVLSSDTMLVTLVDDSVTPPLDVARKMNQLSQPRSSHEVSEHIQYHYMTWLKQSLRKTQVSILQ